MSEIDQRLFREELRSSRFIGATFHHQVNRLHHRNRGSASIPVGREYGSIISFRERPDASRSSTLSRSFADIVSVPSAPGRSTTTSSRPSPSSARSSGECVERITCGPPLRTARLRIVGSSRTIAGCSESSGSSSNSTRFVVDARSVSNQRSPIKRNVPSEKSR